jgi:predicted secreted protein
MAIGCAEAQAQTEAITDDNVDAAVAAAKTIEDHQALAAYFTAKSEQALANAKRHSRMGSLLGSGKPPTSWEAHCHSLVKTSEQQAREYAALAKVQAAMAQAMEHGR